MDWTNFCDFEVASGAGSSNGERNHQASLHQAFSGMQDVSRTNEADDDSSPLLLHAGNESNLPPSPFVLNEPLSDDDDDDVFNSSFCDGLFGDSNKALTKSPLRKGSTTSKNEAFLSDGLLVDNMQDRNGTTYPQLSAVINDDNDQESPTNTSNSTSTTTSRLDAIRRKRGIVEGLMRAKMCSMRQQIVDHGGGGGADDSSNALNHTVPNDNNNNNNEGPRSYYYQDQHQLPLNYTLPITSESSIDKQRKWRKRMYWIGGLAFFLLVFVAGAFVAGAVIIARSDSSSSKVVVTTTATFSPSTATANSPTVAPSIVPTKEPTTARPTAAPIDICKVLNYEFFEVADDKQLDILNDGYSPGDVFLFTGNNLYVSDQQLVGQSSGRCVALENRDDWDMVYCVMQFDFENNAGSINLQGVLHHLSVVGGTGCFVNANGWMQFGRDPDDSSRYSYRFVSEKEAPATCQQPDAFLASPFLENGPISARADETYARIDWDKDGQVSAGDIVVFDSNKFSTANGVQGFVEGECMDLYDPNTESTNPLRRFCTTTFFTENQDILMVEGTFDNMVITVALGCFHGISGTLSGREHEDGGYQYDLLLDSVDGSNTLNVTCPVDLFNHTWTEEFGDLYINYISETPEEDVVVDDEYDRSTAGDAYVFDNKAITVGSTGQSGVASGRCVVLDPDYDTFCNVVFQLDSGSIALQGDFTKMLVVGASGCFEGLQGTVLVDQVDNGFEYTWLASQSPETLY